jgi:hypothetical protein
MKLLKRPRTISRRKNILLVEDDAIEELLSIRALKKNGALNEVLVALSHVPVSFFFWLQMNSVVNFTT